MNSRESTTAAARVRDELRPDRPFATVCCDDGPRDCRLSPRRQPSENSGPNDRSTRRNETPAGFLLIVLLVLPSIAAPDEMKWRRVAVYDGLVTLELPEHWNEIPPDVLEFYILQSAEESGGLMAEIYQHGFRPGNPEADFAPPQVLIQIKENGRLGCRQFLHLPPIEVFREQGVERLEERKGPLLENMKVNEVFFDRDTHSIHVINTINLKDEGEVLVRSVSFLTERGTFTIHCYTLISNHVAMNRVFDSIIDSVHFDHSIGYRPRFADRLPPNPALIAYGIALTLAVLTVGAHLFQRRQRST